MISLELSPILTQTILIVDLAKFLSNRQKPIVLYSCIMNNGVAEVRYASIIAAGGTDEGTSFPSPDTRAPTGGTTAAEQQESVPDAKETAEGLISIKELYGPDLTSDFITTLEALSPVQLQPSQLGAIFRRRLSQHNYTYIVTDNNRKVIATASLLLDLKYTHGGSIVAHIEDVAVHKDFQRRYIGSAIVNHVIKQAWSMKCRKAILECTDNLEPFYAKLGMRRIGIAMRIDNPTNNP